MARGEGADTYRDPREFFRITYMTGGLRKVLRSAIAARVIICTRNNPAAR